MKINIIHSQNNNAIMNDAEILNYLTRRFKGKHEPQHINVGNYTCPKASVNIFIETINYGFVQQAKYNIFIPNHHYFSKNVIPLLGAIDLVLCKTEYCFQVFKDLVPREKIQQIGWRSIDIYDKVIERTRKDWFVLYTDSNYQDVQKLIDIWDIDFPYLNIIFSGVRRNVVEKKNMPNIIYYEKIDPQKYEKLFNSCRIHVVLDTIDNFNHHANQVMLCGNVPVCINKGPILEVLSEDNYFPISCSKKKLKNVMGSQYVYTKEDVLEAVKKVITISDTTLELMGSNNRMASIKNQAKFNEHAEDYFNNILKIVRETPSNNKTKETFTEETLPTISLVTVYTSNPKFFRLPVLNYRSHNYNQAKLEWIIVNNTEDDLMPLLPPKDMWSDFNIKYVKGTAEDTKGTLLNKGVEAASNKVVMIMNDTYFFYQDGLRKIIETLLCSDRQCIGSTTIAGFHINRYISMIAASNPMDDYFDRIHSGTLCFYRDFWKAEPFGTQDKSCIKDFLVNRFNDYQEYSWNEKFVALMYSKNESQWNIPETQGPNGCHYKFSKKVYDFIISLEEIEEPPQEDAEPTGEIKEI